jgi:serine/threonine-protein kinase
VGALAGLTLLILGLCFAWWIHSRKPRQGSIAILPFLNLTGNPENDYFGDGFADDLTAGLANIPSLRVAARTSAFVFRGHPLDSREIGRKLAVDSLLEGAVHKDGAIWVITAQLIDVSNGYHLWAQTYRAGPDALSSIQDEMCQVIPHALGLPSARVPRVAYVPSAAARELFWRGRYARRKDLIHQPEIGYFERAVALEPKYVDAWAWLAFMYAIQADHHQGSVWQEQIEKSRKAARRALELDPRNGLAHATLATLLYSCDWKWSEAEEEFRKAVAFNPNEPAIHNSYAIALELHSRFAEALDEIDRAMALDPLGYRATDDRAEILFMARRYDEAVHEARSVLEMDPSYRPAQLVLGIALQASGRGAEALQVFESLLKAESLPEYLGRYGAVLAACGKPGEAQRVLAQLLSGSSTPGNSPVYPAYIYAALGDKEKAFDFLEKAVQERSADVLRLSVDPMFDPLRAEPRYARLRQTVQ